MKSAYRLFFLSLLIPFFSCASVRAYSASESETQITNALLREDIQAVKDLLARGVSANSMMPASGAPVLTIPLQGNNLEMAKLLVDAGADVNKKDRYGMPLLHLAKKAPMMRLLLEHNADMYAVYKNVTAYEAFACRLAATDEDKSKFYASLKAAKLPQNMYRSAVKSAEKSGWITRQDIVDAVVLYKEFNYDVNRQYGELKQSILLAAAYAENYDFLSTVISRTNADTNIRDSGDRSILNIVTEGAKTKKTPAEYADLVSVMLKKGMRIDAVCGWNDEKATALMIAAQKNNFDRCAALVKSGADVKTLNENRKAAINFARDLKIVKFLVASGADPLNKDKWNQNAIFYQTDPAVIEFLLSKGVNINEDDVDGQTALFCVRATKTVEYLVSKGMDVNHINRNKQSVIEADVAIIHSAMRFDCDLQDEFIPKFRILIKNGLSKTLISNAYIMAKNSSFDMEKVVEFLKPYAAL